MADLIIKPASGSDSLIFQDGAGTAVATISTNNILYSKGGDETVTSIVMDKGSTNSIDNSLKLSGKATYTGVIPGTEISANGFYYRIQLIDDMNNETFQELLDLKNQVNQV